MEFLSDLVGNITNGLVGPLMQNPAMQAMLMGAAVKFAVDRLKFLFKQVDEQGVPEGYKIPLQIVVLVCSAVAAMGDLASKGQLSQYNPELIVNFFTVALPTYWAALAAHKVGNMVLKEPVLPDSK